jgi:hypothetical protein
MDEFIESVVYKLQITEGGVLTPITHKKLTFLSNRLQIFGPIYVHTIFSLGFRGLSLTYIFGFPGLAA